MSHSSSIAREFPWAMTPSEALRFDEPPMKHFVTWAWLWLLSTRATSVLFLILHPCTSHSPP
jgi:hypothetical protein